MFLASKNGAVLLTNLLQGCPDLVYPEQRTACGDSGDEVGSIGAFLAGVRGVDPVILVGEVRGISEIARRR